MDCSFWWGSTGSFTTVLNNGEQGYVAIGNTVSFSPIGTSAWMVKVDNDGNELWNRTPIQNNVTIVYSGQKTSDGGFILAGLRSYPGNPVALIIKTDSEGNELWSKTFGSGRLYIYDYFRSVQETAEGDFIMAGSTVSYSKGNMEDGWLVKVDSVGNELWNHSLGDVDIDGLESVVVCPDGGYIVAGRSKLYGEPLFNAWVLKTDKDGNILWDNRYFEGSESSLNSIIEISDGNYIAVGSIGQVPTGSVKASFGVDAYKGLLLKIDDDGNELWNQTFDNYYSSSFNSIASSNGTYIVAGETKSYETNEKDGLVVLYKDPEILMNEATEDEPSPVTEEQSPLPFTITLACMGMAFIAIRRRL